MPLDDNALQIVAIAGVATGVLGLLLAVAALARIRGLRRSFTVLQGGDDDESIVAAVGRQVAAVDGLRGDVDRVARQAAALRTDLADAIRHVAVVRYDAFGDMGGRLSFSAALLDDAGDGLVITSINGRSETRSYAKGVKAGTSEATLSPEEEQAIGFAMRAR